MSPLHIPFQQATFPCLKNWPLAQNLSIPPWESRAAKRTNLVELWLELVCLYIRDAGFVGHSDQIRQARRLHLAKDLTAMDLRCHLADPELGSDLLVQPAGDDQLHHLPLAFGQRLKTFS